MSQNPTQTTADSIPVCNICKQRAYCQRHAECHYTKSPLVNPDGSPRRPETTTDLTGFTADELASVLSARDQIATDRRCDLRVQCRNLPPHVEAAFCGCLVSAARRVGADIMEREHAERTA